MKIGLIWPNKDRKDKTVHLGLGYIASYARESHPDLEIKLLDTRVSSAKESEIFFNTDFDLIGITVLSPVYHEVIEIFNIIRKHKPDIPICLGGAYVTTIMEEIFLDTPSDFAVYGEGEITFSELIWYLKGERKIEEITGLIYKRAGNSIITNAPREQIKNLDELPIPAYDLFPMKKYPIHRVTTSRGCSFKCVFCNSASIWQWKWRERSPANIIQEIEFLLRNYKRKTFSFSDNSFNIDLERVKEFCNLLLERKIKILWTAEVRLDLINQSIADLMKKAGCYNVGTGIESANYQILKNIRKKISLKDVENGIAIFKAAGIEVAGQFVIGSPGDTLDTISESIEFAKQTQLDFVMFYSILPFKGTEQWEYVQKEGVLYDSRIHNFHTIKPRIVFETPEFSYEERLKAINMARSAGFYVENNNKNIIYDFGRYVTTQIQSNLPDNLSDIMYLFFKKIYRKMIWNK